MNDHYLLLPSCAQTFGYGDNTLLIRVSTLFGLLVNTFLSLFLLYNCEFMLFYCNSKRCQILGTIDITVEAILSYLILKA